jgi:hypothetical protein
MWAVNPLTGRRIKVGGSVYRSLLQKNIVPEVVIDKLPRVEVVKWIVTVGKYEKSGSRPLETKTIDPNRSELLDDFLRRNVPVYWPHRTVADVKDELIENDLFDDYGNSSWYIKIENIGTNF